MPKCYVLIPIVLIPIERTNGDIIFYMLGGSLLETINIELVVHGSKAGRKPLACKDQVGLAWHIRCLRSLCR